MHNLHLFVVRAETGEEACDDVEGQIESWGNENNWRTICGAISENNEIYKTGDGRWEPGDPEDDTIEKLSKQIQKNIDTTVDLKDNYGQDVSGTLGKIMSGKINECDHMEFYRLKKWANAACSAKGWDKDSQFPTDFNVLTDSYLEWELDEFGVTNDTVYDENNTTKRWVVFIDMHS